MRLIIIYSIYCFNRSKQLLLDYAAEHGTALLLAIRASVQHGARARRGNRQAGPLPGLHSRHRLPQGSLLQAHGVLQGQAAKAR